MGLFFKLYMKVKGIKYGKHFKTNGLPFIFNNKKSDITIGDNCTIKSSFLSNLIGLNHRTIIMTRTKDASITIGENVGMSGTTIYARNSITIGDNTLIGANSKIIDNDFHPVDPEDRLVNNISKIKSKPIIIGNNCFIGCDSIILKGVHLGDNCVVGAGSVVPGGDYPPYSIICGNPAKVVRSLEHYEDSRDK